VKIPMAIAGIRGLLRATRHAPDRLLHSSRRRKLVSRLRMKPPGSVGFICYGNICRSPYAAAAASRGFDRAGIPIDVWSAGFIEPGRESPETAQTVARRRGIDLVSHRSRLVIGEIAGGTNWVFVMEPWHARAFRAQHGWAVLGLLGDLDPEPIHTRSIPDPVDRSVEVFEECYARIDRCVGALVEVVSDGR